MVGEIRTTLVDIDDCLLPTNGKTDSAFFDGLKEIAQRVEGGLNRGVSFPFGLCSGRDRNYVEAVASFVGRPNWWSIIESGIALFNPTTKELLINPALTPAIRRAFGEIRRKRLPQILKKFPGLFDYPGNQINIALEQRYGYAFSIEECYEAVKKEIEDLIERGLVIVHHSTIAVDISPASIDKASGILFFSRKTGISPENILGIGDSRGDFPMLKLVGHVGCPANASEECKEIVSGKGGYISPYPYASGVADILHYYLVYP